MLKRVLVNLGIIVGHVLWPGSLVMADNVAEQFRADHQTFFHLLSANESDLDLWYRYQPENEEKDGRGKFDLHDFNVRLEIPVPLDRDLYLRIGGEYEARLYDFDEIVGIRTGASSEALHRAVLRLGAGSFIADDLLVTGIAVPGIYSDFEGTVDEDDFRLFGEGMIVYRFNPGTQILAGIASNEIFDETPIFPFAGLRLMSESGRLYVKVTVPLEGEVSYNLNSNLRLYGGYWITGNEYRVQLGDSDNEFDIHLQDRRAGAGMVVWLGSHINVRFEAGVSTGSEIDFKVRDAGQFSGDLDTTGYVLAGFGVSL